MLTQRDKNILIFLEKHHATSIKQAYRMFYYETKTGYDVARKRLKQLEDMGLMKSYINLATNEKIYFGDRKLSAHDLYVMDFYSLLFTYECEDIKITNTPRYLNGLVVPDALISFKYDNSLYYILLECDLTHVTDLTKWQKYEKLYKDGELQTNFGTFPIIVVMGLKKELIYESQNFDIINVNFELDNFEKIF